MAYDIKVNKVNYNDVEVYSSPLQDGSGLADFYATNVDNAISEDILQGKTAHSSDGAVTGSMPNKSGVGYEISNLNPITIAQGYYDGTGVVQIDPAVVGNITSDNIKAGANILGVQGNPNIVDTLDSTASANTIMNGYTAYVKGQKVTGVRTEPILTYDANTKTLTIE